jgi:pimeloyl-ACP methyl ester carboxylesterase
MRHSIAFALLALTAGFGQQSQNPSPMVEHTRAHTRLKEQTPPGRREAVEGGKLFLPARLHKRGQLPLLIFFHGGTWLPEVAATGNRIAVISMQLGAGSGTYARAFENPERFSNLLRDAEKKSGRKIGTVTLAGWSAGCGAVRQIMKTPEHYARVERVLCIDGIHSGYVDGKPGPEESKLERENLEVWIKLAHEAIAGKKKVIITHSEIFPGTFASTTETTDTLVRELGLKRKPVLKWGPMGTQQLSDLRVRGFRLAGFAGNSAPDHVDQLHSLPTYLKWFK